MRKILLTIAILVAYWQPSIRAKPETSKDLTPLYLVPRVTSSVPSFIEQMPNLLEICNSIEVIPRHIVIRIKEFLEEILPEIPDNNLLKFHFNNVLLLLSTYETILDTKFSDFTEDQEPEDLPVMFQNHLSSSFFKAYEKKHS